MKSVSIKLSILSILVHLYLFSNPILFAQSIQIDPTYNINSIFFNSENGLKVGFIDSLKRIIVHGTFSNGNFPYREDIMRLDEFGNVDLVYSHFPYVYGSWGISRVTIMPNNHLFTTQVKIQLQKQMKTEPFMIQFGQRTLLLVIH